MNPVLSTFFSENGISPTSHDKVKAPSRKMKGKHSKSRSKKSKHQASFHRKETLKKIRTKTKLQKRETTDGNKAEASAKFLPPIHSQNKSLVRRSKPKSHPIFVEGAKTHYGKTKRKTLAERSQERSKKFHKYLKELNETNKIDGTSRFPKSHKRTQQRQRISNNTTREPIPFPPHLKMIEQQLYQTQSFAPNQVYAQTININITNSANNTHKDIEKESQNPEKSNSKVDPYLSEPIAFQFPSTCRDKLHSYRAEGRPTTGQNIFGIDGRVSLNAWINQYTKDKQEFNSLQTFTRYKLQQLKDLLANRQIFEVLTDRASSRQKQPTPTWGGSPKSIANRRFTAKSDNHNIISEVSFKSALCIDLLVSIAQNSDERYSEVLSIIAAQLSKNIFYRSSADKLMDKLNIDTSKDPIKNPQQTAIGDENAWFHCMDNLTLQKLSGLRNYKEKWEETKNAIINMKTKYIKLKNTKFDLPEVDVRSITEKAFKAWALCLRQKKLAKRVAQKWYKKYDYVDPKKFFIAWRYFGNRINQTYYKRIAYQFEHENNKLIAENTMLKETQKELNDQIHKLKTSMSIMSDHLYCDTKQECEERTALRIHKMWSQLKLTLNGKDTSLALKELGFDQYLADYPTEQELIKKYGEYKSRT